MKGRVKSNKTNAMRNCMESNRQLYECANNRKKNKVKTFESIKELMERKDV